MADDTENQQEPAGVAGLQSEPTEEDAEVSAPRHEACVAEAWRLLSEGVYTFRAISRGVNEKTGCKHDHVWVKKALVKHGAMVAETLESGAIDSRAKYLQALYARRASLAGIARDPEARNGDRIAAYSNMVKCDEKIAAAEGVVTERKGTAVYGEAGKPPLRVASIDQVVLALEREKQKPNGGA